MNKGKITRSLKNKGFKETRSKKHLHFVYHDLEDNPTPIMTHISHGSKKDIGAALFSMMASQVKLTNAQFSQFIDCVLTQKQYEKILEDQSR
ncbi:MAG: hypothetical protein GX294_04205 [Candidatus Cloacimonetes bacterium]|nr:hypothetical protein [Candidatus Cloacimonadota bacterium]